MTTTASSLPARPRAREAGIRIGVLPVGPHNAITDVAGVRVGHETIIAGSGPRRVGVGPVRTGVTVIQPHEGNPWLEPVMAGCHTLNGCGEMTGLEWVRESGTLSSPIALTNTHSVGVVRDALIRHEFFPRQGRGPWQFGLPVVAETHDGLLNDIDGQHVTAAHVDAALAAARGGPVPEGNVGGGTAMMCHSFKGGIGTSSRIVAGPEASYTVGVLVQANHGRRSRLTVNGVRVGRRIGREIVPDPVDALATIGMPEGAGSVIVVIATDAPLLAEQCRRLAQRAVIGLGRTGSTGESASGDLLFCFATGNRGLLPLTFGTPQPQHVSLRAVSNRFLTGLFDAVVEATEESVLNALFAARTMTGCDGTTIYELPQGLCLEVLAEHDGLGDDDGR